MSAFKIINKFSRFYFHPLATCLVEVPVLETSAPCTSYGGNYALNLLKFDEFELVIVRRCEAVFSYLVLRQNYTLARLKSQTKG